MHVALISCRYPPETSPAAKRVSDLAAVLQDAGHRTTVLTQLPNYPDPSAFTSYLTHADALSIERDVRGNETWRFRPDLAAKGNLVRRLIAESRFARRAARARTRLSELDGVFATTPFMLSVTAARSYRVPMWLDLRDLTWEYPRSMGRGGVLKRLGARCIKRMVLSCFFAARRISTTTRGQRRYLIDHGVPADRVEVVPNGVPRRMFQKLGRLSRAERADGPLRVVYAGLLGFPQGLAFAVESVAGMSGRDVELHVYGDGVDLRKLRQYCSARGLRHIHLHGHVGHDEYLAALARADVLYASLRPVKALEVAMPSKIWEYMAAGKPVLFAGSGEAAKTVLQTGAGLTVRFGDSDDFRSKLTRLLQSPALREECGRDGRDWVKEHQIREQINARWARSMEAAFAGSTACV